MITREQMADGEKKDIRTLYERKRERSEWRLRVRRMMDIGFEGSGQRKQLTASGGEGFFPFLGGQKINRMRVRERERRMMKRKYLLLLFFFFILVNLLFHLNQD